MKIFVRLCKLHCVLVSPNWGTAEAKRKPWFPWHHLCQRADTIFRPDRGAVRGPKSDRWHKPLVIH